MFSTCHLFFTSLNKQKLMQFETCRYYDGSLVNGIQRLFYDGDVIWLSALYLRFVIVKEKLQIKNKVAMVLDRWNDRQSGPSFGRKASIFLQR